MGQFRNRPLAVGLYRLVLADALAAGHHDKLRITPARKGQVSSAIRSAHNALAPPDHFENMKGSNRVRR
jgi:hypothetical protein